MDAPSLRELQLRLRELIFAHPDSDAGERLALEAAALELGIQGDERLSAADRVLIYGGMHLARIREAIGDDFPALLRLRGERRFDDLIRAYLRAHPTDDCSLRRAARHLPDFLDAHREVTLGSAEPELARLEWSMVEAFDAIDEIALTREQLSTLAPESWADLELTPIRAMVLLDLDQAVDDLRAELLGREDTDRDPGAAPESVPSAPIRLRVWRQSLRVYLRRMSALEADALRQLALDPSFGALCQWIADRPGETEPVPRAAGLLDLWIQDEVLRAPLPISSPGAT